MKLHVLAIGVSRPSDLEKFKVDGSFRKATRNMMIGYSAIAPILKNFPDLTNSAFVLGSSYGELEVTKEFLATLDNQGVARPLLFQSSLHNATLGFLALKLGLTGPSLTVSHRHFTGENALEAASLFLGSGSPLCLTLGVECRVPDIEEAMLRNYPKGTLLQDGAAALLLASDDFVRQNKHVPLATIESFKCLKGNVVSDGSYYDSNALEKIADAIFGRKFDEKLKLNKPDGSFSEISLREFNA